MPRAQVTAARKRKPAAELTPVPESPPPPPKKTRPLGTQPTETPKKKTKTAAPESAKQTKKKKKAMAPGPTDSTEKEEVVPSMQSEPSTKTKKKAAAAQPPMEVAEGSLKVDKRKRPFEDEGPPDDEPPFGPRGLKEPRPPKKDLPPGKKIKVQQGKPGKPVPDDDPAPVEDEKDIEKILKELGEADEDEIYEETLDGRPLASVVVDEAHGALIARGLPKKSEADIVAERVQELRAFLNDKEIFIKGHEANVRAVIAAYERDGGIAPLDTERGSDYSLWMNGRKVTREVAKGNTAWMEALSFSGSSVKPLIPAHQRFPYSGEDIEKGVFGALRYVQGPISPFENKYSSRAMSYWVKVAIRWATFCSVRNKRKDPAFGALQEQKDRFLFQGAVITPMHHDTGATYATLSAEVCDLMDTYHDYKGWETKFSAMQADGSPFPGLLRIAEYCYMHHTTNQLYTGWRYCYVLIPINYKQNPVPSSSLAGLSMLSSDHWVMLKGSQHRNGLQHILPPDLWQTESIVPTYMALHLKEGLRK